jgi:peptidyl-prolyl cis-trans isomerase B (cyclophilin B)
MAEKGWLELERVSRIEDFQSLLGVYGSTELAPLIHYKLANAYFEAERYPDARKEYEFVLKKYPQHFVSQLISQRLKEQKVNEVWSAGELSKHRDELSTKRDLPAVLIKTKKGECEIELYEDDAPNTVANFISLVEQGFYREVCFGPKDEKFGLSLNVLHTPGTPTITAPITTTLNFTIPFETNSLKNKEGSLGMLREIDPDTKTGRPERDKFINSACWKCYIALKPNPDLDGKYTIFGWVTKGMNIIKELQPGDVIDEIVIKKKRAHNYKPTVLPLPR